MTFFYDLNKKLASINKPTEQLNESAVAETSYSAKAARAGKDIGKPGKAFAKIAKSAGERYGSKAAGERVAGAVLNKLRHPKEDVEEGFVDNVKQGAQSALQAIGQTLGHGSDENMIKDLQKKAGVPVTGKVQPQQGQQPGQQPTPMAEEGGEPMTAKQKAFAKLAPPADKITFADKIAGAKKEVDEMLGDVAAEAMKNALVGGQKKLDKNKNGRLDAQDFEMLRKGGKAEEMDEGWDDMMKDVAKRRASKVGDVEHGHKHDIEHTATGRKVTRRVDDKGISVGADDDKPADGEKRGRGRPKKADKAPERVTAKAYKHKGGRKSVEEGSDEGVDMVKLAKVIQSCKTMDQLEAARKMAQNFLRKHSSGNDGVSFAGIGKDMRRRDAAVSDIERKKAELQGNVDERKLSSSEKEEREDIVKGMKKNKGDFKKRYGKRGEEVMYATATKMAKERGPGNPDRKKKEKTEESGTVAGSVAPATNGKAKSNGVVGKGIYDSLNRQLEDMIAESMNVSVNMSVDEHGEPHKNITVSAEGDEAEHLAQLLNLAGVSAKAHDEGEICPACGSADCGCNDEVVDENAPDWPTEPETTGGDDPHLNRWAGGLNKPKETGQTTIPVVNRDPRRGSFGPAEHAVDMREDKDLGMKLYAELKGFKG